MKTFKEILTESKDRFFLKNKNLTPFQKKAFIEDVKRYKKFEDLINTEIGWNNVPKASYSRLAYLLDQSLDTTSSKKRKAKKLRHKGIRGLEEGEDYINVHTKNKYYLTYIPLNYKAAQVIKTVHIGGCVHKGCIGGSQASTYFKSEGKKKKRVAVYVVGQENKWVVMMYPDGRHETWGSENKRGEWGEVIPDFDIDKELGTTKLKKLYKELLEVTWGKGSKDGKFSEDEYDNAVDSYNSMISSIESFFQERIDAKEYHETHNQEEYESIIEQLKEKIEELEKQYAVSLKVQGNVLAKTEEIKKIFDVEPTGTGVNSAGEVVWNLHGIDYTMDELTKIFKENQKYADTLSKDPELAADKIKEDIDKYQQMLDDVEGFEYGGYEFTEYAGMHWMNKDPLSSKLFDDVWSEEGMFEGLYRGVNFEDDYYDDYFEFAESYLDVDENRRDLEMSIYELESDITYGGQDNNGQEILEEIGLPHPEDAN